MHSILANAHFKLACPSCKEDLVISTKDVGHSIFCKKCEKVITIVDTGGFIDELESASKKIELIVDKAK